MRPRILAVGADCCPDATGLPLLFGVQSIILTTAGRQFLPYVSEALSTIATGTLRLPSRRFEEHLAISSFSLFAYKVLLPRLHKFQRCIRT